MLGIERYPDTTRAARRRATPAAAVSETIFENYPALLGLRRLCAPVRGMVAARLLTAAGCRRGQPPPGRPCVLPACRAGAGDGEDRVRAGVHPRPEQQRAAGLDLTAYGCEKIFTDTASGKHAARPELDKALAYLRAGDVLVITRLSRAMRSLKHLLALADELRDRGVGLVVLKQQIDTTTPQGRLVFHLLGAIDEFQRELIVEGTREGLAAARARGRTGGRKPKLDARQAATVRRMYAATGPDGKRQHTVAEIAEAVGVPPHHPPMTTSEKEELTWLTASRTRPGMSGRSSAGCCCAVTSPSTPRTPAQLVADAVQGRAPRRCARPAAAPPPGYSAGCAPCSEPGRRGLPGAGRRTMAPGVADELSRPGRGPGRLASSPDNPADHLYETTCCRSAALVLMLLDLWPGDPLTDTGRRAFAWQSNGGQSCNPIVTDPTLTCGNRTACIPRHTASDRLHAKAVRAFCLVPGIKHA